MSIEVPATTRKRRTWSRFTERKAPTEYEFVSHDLHWHYKPGQVPWEMAPDHVWNRWYIENRNDSPFTCSDWNTFRDPDMLVYRTYVKMQDEAETYVDGVIDDHEVREAYGTLSEEWLHALSEGYTPFRYVGHALLMAATYVMSMAPSSYISNAAAFQGGDELRRIQRIAYQTRQLQLHHPVRGFGDDRPRWESGESWQPLRRVLERLLAERDWGKAFAQLNFVVKPAVDAVFNEVVADAAEANDDGLTAMMHRNLHLDTLRSRRWSTALVNTAIEDSPGNRPVLAGWIAEAVTETTEAVAQAGTLLSTSAAPVAADEVRKAVGEVIDAGLREIGVESATRS